MLFAASLIAPTAHAQISPGPLATPHASLEGPRNCTQCHGGRTESTTQRCVACHREIGWLQQQGLGFHARREARGACSSCHPDHAGRDFALIQWPNGSPERFDHARGTGYALEGSHAEAKCSACHTTRLRTSPAAALSPRRGTAGWIGLETSCTSCHSDPHRGKLAGACTRCHDVRSWDDAPGFDHARTRYPLTGKHGSVTCAGCHLTPRLDPPTDSAGRLVPVFRPVPFKDCVSCHTDPHRGSMTGVCSKCHVSTSSFRAIDRASFDHERTQYPLRGKHASVACASCHGGPAPPARAAAAGVVLRTAAGPGARTVNRPPYQSCTSCHTDAHARQLMGRKDAGACDACHSVDGWRPSSFGVAAHASTRFAIDGAHASVPCASCHAPDRKGLSPLPAAAIAASGVARVVLRPPETTCAQCHTDPHDWRAAANLPACTTCHTTRTFRPTTMSAASHATTSYPLEGAHLAVPCVGCHEPMTRAAARSTLVAATPPIARLTLHRSQATCVGCHEDPHRGQAAALGSGTCDRCHTLRAFVPASLFDHARDARFRLDGAHARVACTACHRQPAGARPGAPLGYGGLSPRCESCHVASARSPARQRPGP